MNDDAGGESDAVSDDSKSISGSSKSSSDISKSDSASNSEEDAKANKKKEDAQSVNIEEVESGDSSDGLEHEDAAPSKAGSRSGTCPLSLASGLTLP